MSGLKTGMDFRGQACVSQTSQTPFGPEKLSSVQKVKVKAKREYQKLTKNASLVCGLKTLSPRERN